MDKLSLKPGVILVTDAGLGSAITLIRSLGRRGWRVVAADADPDSLGFRSRYASSCLVYPSPATSPAEFVQVLCAYVSEQNVKLVIPVTDSAILPLAEQRERFIGIQLAIPEPDALQTVTDKMQTLELAQRVGVPIPQTCLVYTSQEALEAVKQFSWPVVLKPMRSRVYRQAAGIEAFTVTYADGAGLLKEKMQLFEGRCPVLLQEYYAGVGQGVELLMNHGRPLAAFQHRRLREIPIHGGASAFRESVAVDPQLYAYATVLLAELNWTGLAMVEFKVGEAGPKLMEINGRVWGSIPLAVYSGIDFPALLADLYLSPFDENGKYVLKEYATGIRARNLDLDMLWILSVLRGKQRYPFFDIPPRSQALKALAQLFHPKYRFDMQTWDDPQPGLAELPKIFRKLGRKIWSAG